MRSRGRVAVKMYRVASHCLLDKLGKFSYDYLIYYMGNSLE